VTGLPDWTRRAHPLDAVTIEIGFVIRPDFYFGPENVVTERQWASLRQPGLR
jgi:hypothetical protein